MMTRVSKYILVAALTVLSFGITAPAQAVVKLDFISPVTDFLMRVNKVRERIENVNQKITLIMQKKVMFVETAIGGKFGPEGMALYHTLLPGGLNSVAGGVHGNLMSQVMSGNFNANSLWQSTGIPGTINVWEDKVNNYKNLRLDLASAQYVADDIERAERMRQQITAEKIKTEIATLDALINAAADGKVKDSEENIEAYVAQRAELQKQLVEVMSSQPSPNLLRWKNYVASQNQELTRTTAEMQKYVSLNTYTDKATKEINALLGENAKDSQDEIYKEYLEKLFLKKSELAVAANIERVRKNRQEEYYNAVVDLLYVATNNNMQTQEIKERLGNLRDGAGKADTLTGAEDMKILALIELDKAAALFTQLNLAKIRLDTATSLQSWNNIYTLRNYSHDFTSFDLNYYSMNAKKTRAGDTTLSRAKGEMINESSRQLNDLLRF